MHGLSVSSSLIRPTPAILNTPVVVSSQAVCDLGVRGYQQMSDIAHILF